MSEVYGLWNKETGELLDREVRIETLEDEQKKKEIIEYRKSQDELKVYIDENYGGFYFMFNKLLDENISKQYIVRFLYLCTFMDYENKLLFGSAKDNNNKYMFEKDFQEVLKLNKTEVSYTKKALISNNLILIDDEGIITVNKKYCIKGKIPKNKNDAKVRTFESGLKNIYEKSKSTEHKRIAYLFQLLPFIHRDLNVVCKNPSCENESEVTPLNIKDICKIVGYNETNSSRLKKELLSMTVNEELVVMFHETKTGKFITINPRIFYKGGDIESMKGLTKLFTVKGK